MGKCWFVLAGGMLLASASLLLAAESPASKTLFDPASADAAKQIITMKGTTFTVVDGAIEVAVDPDATQYFQGILIRPPTPWNAGEYGHVEAPVTNLGDKPLRLSLRIDPQDVGHGEIYSADSVTIPPGKTGTLSVLLGYKWGTAIGEFKPEALIFANFFTGKTAEPLKYRIGALRAAGPAGEKPFVDPHNVAAKVPDGAILGGKAAFDPAKQLAVKGGARITEANSSAFTVAFTGKGTQSVTVKPAIGMWNLNEHLQITARVRNVGAEPATLSTQLLSRRGHSPIMPVPQEIAPNAEVDLLLPFAAPRPWTGVDVPAMHDGKAPAKNYDEPIPGTGTLFASNCAEGVVILSDKPATLQVSAITASQPSRQPLPEWLGKRPPVEGDWTLNFEDNFDGPNVDLHKWNIYGENYWDKRTHFARENTFIKDGNLVLRVSKKRGYHNDDPTRYQTDQACGYADTFGKFTQRYGYWEARMKLPTAPFMFLAFWLMPDRGYDEGPQWKRARTTDGGMEFDILEWLSTWGQNRHNFGVVWDGYEKFKKGGGQTTQYYQPDADGYVTSGMLWTPGSIVLYQNGRPTARWDNARIGSVQSNILFDHITGSWENDTLDEKQLPADFLIDYVRVWQRKDLATPEDGLKPNDGGPLPKIKP